MKMKKVSRKALAMMAVAALMGSSSVFGANETNTLVSNGWANDIPVQVKADGDQVAASLMGQNVSLNDVTANNVTAGNVVTDSFSTTDGGIIATNGSLAANKLTGDTIQNADGTFQVNGSGDVTATNVTAGNVVTDSFSTTDGGIIATNGSLAANKLTGDTIQNTDGTFQVNGNGDVTANNITAGNVISDTFQNEEGTFLVAGDGSVTSVKVNGEQINGEAINGNTINGSVITGETIQTSDGHFQADANGNVTATTVNTTGFSVSDDQGNTNFQVTADGSFTAQGDANVQGDLTVGGDLKVGNTVVKNSDLASVSGLGAMKETVGTSPINVKDNMGNKVSTLTDAVNTNYAQIQQNSNAISSLGSRVSDLGDEIDNVGAISAALAGLHPLDYNGTGSKFQLSAAVGTYDGTQAAAIGGFYHFNQDIMLSLGGATSFDGDNKTAANLGVTFRIGEGASAKAAASDDIMARLEAMDQKIAALEQENKDLKDEIQKAAETEKA